MDERHRRIVAQRGRGALAFARARSSASRGDRVRRARAPRVADRNARHRMAIHARVARRPLRGSGRPCRGDDRRDVRGERRDRPSPRAARHDRAPSTSVAAAAAGLAIFALASGGGRRSSRRPSSDAASVSSTRRSTPKRRSAATLVSWARFTERGRSALRSGRRSSGRRSSRAIRGVPRTSRPRCVRVLGLATYAVRSDLRDTPELEAAPSGDRSIGRNVVLACALMFVYVGVELGAGHGRTRASR